MKGKTMENVKVVIVGTMFGNKTIHGPFEDDDDIKEWVAVWAGDQPYEIELLLSHGITTFR